MKVCPKCQSNHEKPGTFCSRSCANSRQHQDSTKRKQSLAAKRYFSSLTIKERKTWEKQCRLRGKVRNINAKLARLKRILESNTNELSYEEKRIKVILEQKCCCLDCGLSEWKNQRITLELDHIDGNNKNNERNNLRALCPNCHSMTPTWRGRNTDQLSKRQKALMETYNTMVEPTS